VSKKTKFGELTLGIARTQNEKDGTRRKVEHPNIIEYIESSWGLNRRLFPVQRVILKAFYGIKLGTQKKFEVTDWRRRVIGRFTEEEYLQWLYDQGRSNIAKVVPGKALRQLILPIGRRSGKTELAAFITAYEADKLLAKDNPQMYYGIAQGDKIGLCTVATGKDQAAELYAKASHHFLSCNRFDPYRANMTATFTKFQTKYEIDQFGRYGETDNAKSSVQVTFYSCNAKGLRGAGNIVVVLDEIAHFIETSGHSGAHAVYSAVTPSVAAFSPKDPNDLFKALGASEGRVILISSPLSAEGFFYEKFKQGFQRPDHMLCIRAPTWEVNPTVPAEELEGFYLDNPEDFWREFGADFQNRTRNWLGKTEELMKCVDKTLIRAQRAPARQPHFMGLDLGVVKGGDGTAIAIGHIDENQQIVLDYMEWIRAGYKPYEDYERLDFEEIADWVYGLSRKFYITEGIMDRWAGLPMEQRLHKKGLKQIKAEMFSPQQTTFMYKTFKDLMWDGKLRLYDWDPEWPPGGRPKDVEFCGYLEELLALQEEKVSKYVSKIEAPKGGDLHDDRSDALIRMVWLASQRLGNPRYLVRGGSSRSGMGGDAGLGLGRRNAYINSRRKALLGGSHRMRQASGKGVKIR
jgi:hypothetical protein